MGSNKKDDKQRLSNRRQNAENRDNKEQGLEKLEDQITETVNDIMPPRL